MATRMQKRLCERFGLDERMGYVPARHRAGSDVLLTGKAATSSVRPRTRLTFKRDSQAYCWQTDRGLSRLIKH